MSKVISFSLWGNDPKYSEGMVRNAELAKELFPDWECWVYVKRNGGFGPVSTFLELDNMDNVKFMPMHMNAGSQGFATDDWRGMFWRFEPASNSDVEVMISRDQEVPAGMINAVAQHIYKMETNAYPEEVQKDFFMYFFNSYYENYGEKYNEEKSSLTKIPKGLLLNDEIETIVSAKMESIQKAKEYIKIQEEQISNNLDILRRQRRENE